MWRFVLFCIVPFVLLSCLAWLTPGFVDAYEVRVGFANQRKGGGLGFEQIYQLFRDSDRDSDGMMSAEEYVDYALIVKSVDKERKAQPPGTEKEKDSGIEGEKDPMEDIFKAQAEHHYEEPPFYEDEWGWMEDEVRELEGEEVDEAEAIHEKMARRQPVPSVFDHVDDPSGSESDMPLDPYYSVRKFSS
uniref:EF-hand domain-containing protein n=1 Tax=Chromera velia CCMP2878 TaxID=1169474 RepID=A0A0G4ICA7_9ALVE|eukprot:Cvel_2235.t1-p1 / transcript=Cvel_2235.t1 / gene=Cvel_2235 / organism=Chromera_velia_CCMP2878 / gene_product=hypothetical protein / transcript_product=hypothetical protein / location=Cvel_scaffold86:50487-52154(-) / protein_length=188 / sequence_SO=supercontig / SO=protein_coding / is_pseudo=false